MKTYLIKENAMKAMFIILAALFCSTCMAQPRNFTHRLDSIVEISRELRNAGSHRERYLYDFAGHLLEIAKTDTFAITGIVRRSITLFEYDKNGCNTVRTDYRVEDKTVPYHRFVATYDANNIRTGYDKYRYDAGQWVLIEHQDLSQEEEESTKGHRQQSGFNYDYDAWGNLIRIEHAERAHYTGSTNYFYDMSINGEQTIGLKWYEEIITDRFDSFLLERLSGFHSCLVRIANYSKDGTCDPSPDFRIYYSSIPR